MIAQAAVYVPGYTSMLQQLTTFIFKSIAERRRIEEIQRAIDLTQEGRKPCETELACVSGSSMCSKYELPMATPRRLAALQQKAACIQQRADKQLHVNATLKHRMASMQEKV